MLGGKQTYVSFQTSLVDNLVDIIRRHARLRGSRSNIQDLSRKPAHLAHALNLLRIEDGNLVPPDKLLLRVRYAVFGVVWELHARRDLPPLRQRIDGSEGSGVGVGGERVEGAGGWIGVRNDFGGNETGEKRTLRLVRLLVLRLCGVSKKALAPVVDLTMYPVALEAVLRAEEAFLAQLLAVGALQLACVVGAVLARALARDRCVSSHGGVLGGACWVGLGGQKSCLCRERGERRETAEVGWKKMRVQAKQCIARAVPLRGSVSKMYSTPAQRLGIDCMCGSRLQRTPLPPILIR